jgi:hypothetical protein
MQDVALEVESDVLVVDIIENKADRDGGRKRFEASTFGSSASHPQVDELTNMVKSIFCRDGEDENRGEAWL